jgi:Tol biopolymer transport system component
MKIMRLTTGGKVGTATVIGETAITPDGKYIVFVTAEAGRQALWVRQVSTNSLLQIVAPVQGYYTGNTFSPDGEFVYFSRVDNENVLGALYQVPVLGGTPRRLLTKVDGPITFSPDGGRIAFVRNDRSQSESSLMLANTDGSGEKRVATRKYPNSYSTGGISWSPTKPLIACGVLVSSGKKSATVVGVPVDGGAETPLTSQTWADVRHVVWLGDGTGLVLTATPEWSSAGTQVWFLSYPQGEARRITNDLNGYGGVSLGITADASTIVTVQEDISAQLKVTEAKGDSSGVQEISSGKYDGTNGLTWSSEGKLVSVNLTGDHIDIWTMRGDGTDARQLTSDDSIKSNPSVSPDGRYIVFASNRSGQWNIWRMDADGSNLKQLTDTGPDDLPQCTPDGKWVVFVSARSAAKTIWRVPIDGGTPTQITEHVADSFAISPDGKLLAYSAINEQLNNQPQIVIIPFEGGQPTMSLNLPASANLSGGLAWTVDGHSVTYLDQLNQAGNIWSIPMQGGTARALTSFKSKLIFRFALSRDGKQLAVSQGTVSNDIVLIKDFK